MADYHTVYKGPEGQTTQWEDIQIKLGNMAPKPPKHKPAKFEPEVEVNKNKDWVDAHDEADLSEAEDEFSDDRVLEQHRLERLKELQEAAKRPRFGTLDIIRSSDFTQAVTDASHKAWVVVLLFKDDHEACAVLSECLAELAAAHMHSKFVKIVSTDCIANYPDARLPTVLLYHEGVCQKTFTGLTIWGGKRASAEYAALVLNQEGAVCRKPGVDSQEPDEQEMKQFVKRVVLQRQRELDDDENSDFED